MFKAHLSTVKDRTIQFATYFTQKDADGIGSLLADHFSLYDPVLKWVQGKDKVVDLFRKQFQETEKVSYEVINAYESGNTGILEFKITMDQLVLYGVDFMEWHHEKMTELRCYFNPPNPPQNEGLKPFSMDKHNPVFEKSSKCSSC